MSAQCDVCETAATSNNDVYLDVDHSDDAMWHQQDPGSYNQTRTIVCGSCMNSNWPSWRARIISIRRMPRPLDGGTK